MTRRCPDCGLEEHRGVNTKGRTVVNLDPTTSRCLRCTIAAAKALRTFTSRREATHGETVDAKALAARNEE